MARMAALDVDVDAAFRELVLQLEVAARRAASMTWTRGSRSTQPIKNVALLQQALEHVTEHPEQHDQGTWARRTPTGVVGCLAYHITRLAGHVECWSPNWASGDETGFVATATNARTMREVAREELGATVDQTTSLFSPWNSLDKLWQLAEEYTNGQITRKEKV